MFRVFNARAAIFFTVLLAALFSASPGMSGQLDLGEPLDAAEAASAFDRIKNAQAGIDSVLARVRQTKSSPLLDKDIVTEGSVLLKKPDLMRWEIVSPQKMVVVADGEALWVYRPAKRDATKRLLAGDMVARYTVGFLSSSMNFSLDEISKNFKLLTYVKDDATIILFQPKSKMLSRFLKDLKIFYGPDGLPRRFEVQTKDGSTTSTEIGEVVVNSVKDNTPFSLKLPSGTVVRTLGAEETR